MYSLIISAYSPYSFYHFCVWLLIFEKRRFSHIAPLHLCSKPAEETPTWVIIRHKHKPLVSGFQMVIIAGRTEPTQARFQMSSHRLIWSQIVFSGNNLGFFHWIFFPFFLFTGTCMRCVVTFGEFYGFSFKKSPNFDRVSSICWELAGRTSIQVRPYLLRFVNVSRTIYDRVHI